MGGEVGYNHHDTSGWQDDWPEAVLNPNAITERAVSARELRSLAYIASVLDIEIPHTTMLFGDRHLFAETVFNVRREFKRRGVEQAGAVLEQHGVPPAWIGWLLSAKTGYINRRVTSRVQHNG